jgi:toxin FitB
MSYLIDTNVISEFVRSQPNQHVVQWVEKIPPQALYISVLTIGDIRKGVEKIPSPSRREKIRLWLEQDLPEWFEDRILHIDLATADRWGRLLEEVGRSVPAIDSLLAATALHHELRIITRNINDFKFPGLEVVNPWELSY